MKLFGIQLGKRDDDVATLDPAAPAAFPITPAPPATATAAATTAAAPQMAPGTEIRYDANLVPHFVTTHQQLAQLVTSLRASVVAGRYHEATQLLRQFKVGIFQHFLEENVRFYTYLTYCLKNDPEGSEIMADMRQEMGQIGRAVTRFVKAYATGIDAGNASTFLPQLDGVIATLSDRIQREETSLYTLYQPPGTFADRG